MDDTETAAPDETHDDVPRPPESIDLDAPSYTVTPEQGALLLGPRRAREVSKPDISHLPDALGPDGRPLFRPGDKIVIERHAAVLAGSPYLDTRTYRVLALDEASGNVALYDDSLAQHAGTNWRSAPRGGDVFKFAAGTVSSRRKRGRPKKSPAAPLPAPALLPDGTPVKRKRGRPPGKKNRPRDVVAAEKAERAARRRGKT